MNGKALHFYCEMYLLCYIFYCEMHLPQVNVSRVNTALVYCSPAALANQRLLSRDLTVRKKTPPDISL